MRAVSWPTNLQLNKLNETAFLACLLGHGHVFCAAPPLPHHQVSAHKRYRDASIRRCLLWLQMTTVAWGAEADSHSTTSRKQSRAWHGIVSVVNAEALVSQERRHSQHQSVRAMVKQLMREVRQEPKEVGSQSDDGREGHAPC